MAASRTEALTIPPALVAELQAVADAEHRPLDDVVRDVIEHGLGERWQLHAEHEWQQARDLGLPNDDQPLTGAYRRRIREKIAAGIRSAGEGRLVDGEAVFARIFAELDEREGQGRG